MSQGSRTTSEESVLTRGLTVPKSDPLTASGGRRRVVGLKSFQTITTTTTSDSLVPSRVSQPRSQHKRDFPAGTCFGADVSVQVRCRTPTDPERGLSGYLKEVG